jgi:ribosomal-protein-alanine N-acetyltransferase
VDILVRLARPGDRDAIAELARDCGLDLDVDRELEREWARWWVAHLGPAHQPLAGLLLAWEVADELHVIDLGTRPDCRRCGVARRLVDALLDHAASRRLRLVILEVRSSNAAALALYRTAGFGAVAVRESYYSNPPEDAIVMHLAFDPSTGRPLPPGSETATGES